AVGLPLAGLCLLWILGRFAMSSGSLFSPAATAVVDLAFVPAVFIALARPLVAAKNRRNFVMLAVLAALFAANLMTHLDALGSAPGWQRRGIIVALDVVVVLMLVIAGRVLPMFTRNATGEGGVRSIPALDAATIASMAVLTALDVFASSIAAPLAGITAALAAARAIHWGTRHTIRHPLLWILHVGYAWIPLGLLLRAAGSLDGAYGAMATHALTAGAIGALTLGMMARVSLGHTGRPLTVGRPMTIAFAAITIAAAMRVAAPLLPRHYLTLLIAAGVLWTGAFLVYLVKYARILVSPRVDGRAG
ncbi:MAG TPA: NnrS family protein, partial [Labilithrix sp.]|nr:NnrS family protein [Labilithrix sp.]